MADPPKAERLVMVREERAQDSLDAGSTRGRSMTSRRSINRMGFWSTRSADLFFEDAIGTRIPGVSGENDNAGIGIKCIDSA